MCEAENELNISAEEALAKLNFLGLPLKADKLQVVGSIETDDTQMVSIHYIEEDLSVAEVQAFDKAADKAEEAQDAQLGNFVHLSVAGYIHKADPTRAAVEVQAIYLTGKDAAEIAQAIRFREQMRENPTAVLASLFAQLEAL